jgi:fatty-acyl-CoA synthase
VDPLRRSARRTPHKTAIIFAKRRYTYAELDVAVNRVANAFSALGVSPGDRVALLSHNSDEYAIAVLAMARAGAICVPINFMLNAAEVAYILEGANAVAMLAEGSMIPVADTAISQTGKHMGARIALSLAGVAAPSGWSDFGECMAFPNSEEPSLLVRDEDAVQIMYTSGTESRPKGAVLSSRSLLAQYASCIVDGDIDASDISIHALPLYHCAQQHCFLLPALYVGGTGIILPSAEPKAILETIERERVTSLFCPPTVWIALLRHPAFASFDLSSLAKGYYGASIMPTAVIEELLRRFAGIRLYNFYGQTEMSPMATVLRPEDQLRKLGSAGLPALNVETRVVDENDQPVPTGTVGEIVHRGPHVLLEYWDNPAATANAFRSGWFHSGDLGRFDEDGYLYVVDRKKDMIKSGGENVSSREVEEVLFSHPAVSEVAVIGVPHSTWIEAVTAAVILRPNADANESTLLAYCRERLAGYKTPKRILLVGELPKNASGKILKRELREQMSKDSGA